MKTMSDYVWEHGFIMGLIIMFWVMTVSFFTLWYFIVIPNCGVCL